MPSTDEATLAKYGFTAISRDINVVLEGRKNNKDPKPVLVSEIEEPNSELAKFVKAYAKKELPEACFNHSMRVFFLGQAIAREQFPDWKYDPEVYYLTALLHDIGTTEKNLSATKLSFEFYGGYITRDLLLKESNGDQDLAESVAEAIIRHQDIGQSGKITTVGLLVQLATILDNMGGHKDLVHEGTLDDVVAKFPRKSWSKCFAAVIRSENSRKPWAHTTSLGEEDFPNGVLGNELMNKYEY